MAILSTDNLRKTFSLPKEKGEPLFAKGKRLVAVNQLSLSFEEGEIYGLLGPNGAGKTTALRMIASLIKPEEGKIFYQGEDIEKNLTSYRKEIGFLTSELKLDGFFTPNQTFDYFARLYAMDEKEAKEEKEILFERFRISEYRNKKIDELSTGMKQKCSLALSLAHKPKIVIFDEPTNGLDIVASQEVEQFLLDLKKSNHLVLLSTHIFSLAEKLCDRIGILLHGELKKEDTKEKYKEEGGLEKVFFALYEKEEGDNL